MKNLFEVKCAPAAFTSKVVKSCVMVFTLLILIASSVNATTTNTMTNVGSWSNGTNWSLGHEPTNAEDVIIPSDIVATIDVNAVCASLTIGDNSTSAIVTISGTNSLTITTAGGGTGNLYFNSSNSNSVFQFNVNGGSLFVMGQVIPGGFNGGEINVTSGSVRFTGTSALTWGEAVNLNVSGSGSATFDGPLNLTTVSSGSTTFSLTGNGSFVFNDVVTQSSSSCTISNTGTAGSIYFNNGYTLSGGSFNTMSGENIYFGNDFTNSGSSLIIDAGANSYFSASTSVTPTSLITFGNVIINSGVNLTLNGNISVAGNWTNNGGTLIPTSSTVSFIGTSGQSINGTSASQTFNNISLNLTSGQALTVSGSTTSLTVNNLNMVTGNFTAGTASTVNINGDLAITSGTYTPGSNTNIGGNFSNSGTYTAAITNMLSFVGASSAVISGSGTFTIYDLTLNKSTKNTVVDIQSANFVNGINTGNVYNFTLTKGTFKFNNSATLNDCHNQGTSTALTIPYDVVIESNAGTLNLCKSGTMAAATRSNVILSGKLFITGGTVRVLMSTSTIDFQYKVNGGTPQLYVSSGSLYLGGGFNYDPTANVDYLDFYMDGGQIYTGTISNNLSTFALGNFAGGSTVMSGGTIYMEERSTGAYADLDFGGSSLTTYSVTGGTIQIGTAGTVASTTFKFQAYANRNYPHIVLLSGIAKTLRPANNDDFKMLSLTIGTGTTFNMSDVLATVLTHKLTLLSANGGAGLSNLGTFTAQQGTVEFAGNTNQTLSNSAASMTLYNLEINNSGFIVTGASTLTTLTVQNLTVTSGTFNPGTITTTTINGSVVLTSGTYGAPATMTVKGNWTNNGGTFTRNSSTITFNGVGAQTIGGTATSETFYNVINSKTSPDLLSTTGSITALTTNNFTNTTSNFTAPASMTIAGNLTLTNGTFTAGANMYVGGNWTHATTASCIFTHSNGTVTFNGSGTQTINGTKASETFYNLVINKTASTMLTKGGSIATITVQDLTQTQGDFTMPATFVVNGNFTLASGTAVAGTTLSLYGNWTQNSGSSFTKGTSTISFLGGTAQTINGTASAVTFNHMIINKTAGISVTTGGSVASLSVNNYTNTQGNFSAPSSLTVTGNTVLTDGTFTSGANIYLSGSWSHAVIATCVFTPNGGTVNFVGTGTQTINGTKTSETFSNVVINKTIGTTVNFGGSVATFNAVDVTMQQGNFNPPGTSNITGNLSILTGTLTASTTLNLQGNWTQNTGATFTQGTGTINFTGGNTQTIQGTASSITFYNYVINKTASTIVNTSGSVATLSVNNFTNTLGDFTAPAALNVAGTYTLTAGTFTAGTTMNITGSWSIATAATFTHNNGTVNFIGGLAQTLGGTKTAVAFYDVVVNKTSGFALTRGGSVVTMTARNITQTQGNFNFSGATTLTLSGNYVLSAGTFTPGTNFNLAGDWTHQSGAVFTIGTGTTTMNGSGAQTIQGTIGTESFYNLTINKTGSSTLTVDPSITSLTVQAFTETAGNFNANNTMIVNGNATLTAGTFTAGSNLSLRGNLSKATAAIFTPGTGTVTFDAAVAQTINGTSTSLTFNDVVINKGAATTLATGGSVATLTFNNLQHTLGGFTSPATLNINGNYTQDGGTLTFGTTVANIYGNWIRNAGTFTPGTSTVKLLGSSSAQTVGGTTTTAFNNFQINNTYATPPQISVTANLSSAGTLTLTNGIVNLNSNTITLGTSAAANGTLAGGSSSSYLSKGTFNRWYATTTVAAGNIRGLFPVGDYTGNGYSPYYVSAPVTAPTVGGTIALSYSDAITNQMVAIIDGASTIEVRTDAGWTSTAANGLAGGSYNLSASRAFGATYVGALANLRLTLASTVVGTSGTNSGTLTNPVITRTGLASTELSNVFYVGSTSYYSSPLPIELGDFKATPKNSNVELNWFTFTESENDYFTVERSKDGVHFEKVCDVDGAGNSSTLKNYSAVDINPFNGVSFYRLTQTDFNGDSKECKVVSVRINNTKSAITSVYPNPNNGTLIYAEYFSDVTESVNVELVDVIGRIVFSNSYNVTGGETNSLMIQPDVNLMAGKYLLVLTGDAGKFCSHIFVK